MGRKKLKPKKRNLLKGLRKAFIRPGIKELKDPFKSLDPESFDRMLEDMKQDEKRREEEAEKLREKKFLEKAKKAGFSKSQLEFLRENFASLDHEHWDGRIG